MINFFLYNSDIFRNKEGGLWENKWKNQVKFVILILHINLISGNKYCSGFLEKQRKILLNNKSVRVEAGIIRISQVRIIRIIPT